MTNKEFIDSKYKKAVEGIDNEMMEDTNTKWYDYITSLPIHLQLTYMIVVMHKQIFNGGLHQYFLNSYGQFAYLTIEYLKLIEAYKTAEILNKAVSNVNKANYTVEEFRNKILNRKLDSIVNFEEELFNFLDELDGEYYHSDEDLEKLLAEYLITV